MIRSSASLIIAKPILNYHGKGCNYQVLLMKRNSKSSFMNAHVYPGGVVDKADHYTNWFNHQITEKEGNILTNKICAIRETFEESGLLLCKDSNNIAPSELNEWREIVHQDATQFKVMCEKYNISPALNQLIPFSQWITPTFEKKRYDTLFFLTILHDASKVKVDGKETVLFDWYKPEDAIQEYNQNNIILIPPQWYSLNVFKDIQDYRQLESNAGVDIFKSKTNELLKILPQRNETSPDSVHASNGYSTFLAYPGDENYKSNDYLVKTGNRHRLYFKGHFKDLILERNIKASNVILNQNKI